ncbi:MAG: DUF3297 family protein, partial [Caulobacteraceae bacterium]|nr:DUF3297 family protein [Caulobacteraceae bacterium]
PNRELLVLAFHEIDDPAQAVMPGYAISPQAFEAQLTWLQAQGFHLVNLDQVLAAQRGGRLPTKPVLLSFDDGYASVYREAFPILKRHHAPAIVAVVGRWLEPSGGMVQFGDERIPRSRLLSWDQLREMQRSGLVEVASHSYDLHKGINGNPQGNSMPAATTRLYSETKGYESDAAYQRRLRTDLRTNADLLQQGIGIKFRGEEKTNVDEYCVSEGWVKVAVGNKVDRKGNPMTIKLSGPVEPYIKGGE